MGKKENTAIDKKEAAIELVEVNRKLEEIDNLTKFVNAPIQLWCGKWHCDDTGVYKLLPGKHDPEQLVRIEASYQQIIPIGVIENIETGEYRYIIAFSVKRSNTFTWKTVKIEPITCSTKNKIIALSNLGIAVNDNTAKLLVTYFADIFRLNQNMIPAYKSISRLGWIGNQFFPYIQNIIFDGDNEQEKIEKAIAQKGNYEIWKRECQKYRKNLIVRLMMAASFASTLIEKIGGLPFSVHVWGSSGAGKTVALIVAASIWGEPDTLFFSVDATINFFTNRAAFMRNLPMLIDEAQLDRSMVDKLIYSLAEGKVRGRLDRNSKEKESKTWNNVSIFTGESPAVNANSGAGAINRVLEIELDGPLFENFTDTLSIVRENYGYAGRKFIEHLQDVDISKLKNMYYEMCKELERYDSTGKQIQNLSFLMLADRIAGKCIFQDEKELDVNLIARFLKSKKEVSVAERAYQRTVDWIASNPVKFSNDSTYEVWGKKDKGYVYVIKSTLVNFLQENNFSFDSVKSEWAELGLLDKDNTGQYAITTRICGTLIRCPKIKLPDNQEKEEETDFKQLSVEDMNTVPFVTDQ